MLATLKMRLSAAMLLSIAFHAFGLFGVAFVLPDPRNSTNAMQPLQVVLVNSKSKSKPVKADALAQANLDGGGNTTEDKQAKSSLPTLKDDTEFVPEQKTKSSVQLEQETQRMLTQLKSNYSVVQPLPKKDTAQDSSSGDD